MTKKYVFLIEGLVIILLLLSCTSREMKKAKEFMDAGMYSQAISLLDIEIQTNPKNAEASFLLGKCFLQTSQNGKVEEYFNRAILLDPKYIKQVSILYFNYANELLTVINRPNECINYFEKCIQLDPSRRNEIGNILYNQAKEYETKNEISLFLVFAKKSAEINNEYNSWYLNLKDKYEPMLSCLANADEKNEDIIEANGQYTKPTISLDDLKGNWIAVWDKNDEIAFTITGKDSFTGKYTNIPGDGSVFKGSIHENKLEVKQYYGDGRLYGTYTFTYLTPKLLKGKLVDYATSYNDVVWKKKEEVKNTAILIDDLKGTWIAVWDKNNEIAFTITGKDSFTGKYTNIPGEGSFFKGSILENKVEVKQYYEDGRLYGTYTFTYLTPTLLKGRLVDYAKSYNDVVWKKKEEVKNTAILIDDLKGTWIAVWDKNNEIAFTITGKDSFTGKYTNIPGEGSFFKGSILENKVEVKQYYEDGRLYGTYTFTYLTPTLLKGRLVDYAKSYNNVVWQKK